MPSEITCRGCGVVLALVADVADTEAAGFVMNSPVDDQYPIQVFPRSRVVLRCSRCGTMREWHPPARSRKRKRERSSR
ncbi:MAG: hypothetical protein HC884_02080 [Chloroflexaceae bacterium]|nr:hypothetical protein [Chloroflexaceae bacterium]